MFFVYCGRFPYIRPVVSVSVAPRKASIMTAGSPFGPRQGGFVYVDLICTGSEPSILGCFQNFTGFKNSCSADNFGIICSECERIFCSSFAKYKMNLVFIPQYILY